MNIEYLKNEIIPQREKEIEEGKNLATRQPIYVVLDLDEHFCEGHSELMQCTNEKGVEPEQGYVDMAEDPEDRSDSFSEDDEGMTDPEPCTRFWTDRFIAFFLTSKGAHEYKKYQSHNLKNPYVFVFYSGYGNKEMDGLLNGN